MSNTNSSYILPHTYLGMAVFGRGFLGLDDSSAGLSAWVIASSACTSLVCACVEGGSLSGLCDEDDGGPASIGGAPSARPKP